jgi:hypothetical protein
MNERAVRVRMNVNEYGIPLKLETPDVPVPSVNEERVALDRTVTIELVCSRVPAERPFNS